MGRTCQGGDEGKAWREEKDQEGTLRCTLEDISGSSLTLSDPFPLDVDGRSETVITLAKAVAGIPYIVYPWIYEIMKKSIIGLPSVNSRSSPM